MCLTATLEPEVQSELVHTLHLDGAQVIRAPIHRPEHVYQVQVYDSEQPALQAAMDTVRLVLADWTAKGLHHKRALVFCPTRAMAGSTSKMLQQMQVAAAPYHGDLAHDDKEQRHAAWKLGSLSVLTCTTAFSTAVDYAHVGLVVAVSLPFSVPELYQQWGRSGRDREPSNCLLFAWRTAWVPGGLWAAGVTELLDGSVCIRTILSRILEPGHGVLETCLTIPGASPCSVCHAQVEAPTAPASVQPNENTLFGSSLGLVAERELDSATMEAKAMLHSPKVWRQCLLCTCVHKRPIAHGAGMACPAARKGTP